MLQSASSRRTWHQNADVRDALPLHTHQLKSLQGTGMVCVAKNSGARRKQIPGVLLSLAWSSLESLTRVQSHRSPCSFTSFHTDFALV